jgi:predicted component of type VI protein secretion system
MDGRPVSKNINTMQTISIGRHPNCDIVLGDPHVSRRHASIYFTDGSFHIHNTSRTNPILFNDMWPISHNLRADLQIGDAITIGRVRLKVVLPNQVSSHNGHNGNGNGQLKHRCPACSHLMDYGQENCSWCGSSLADAETVELEPERSFMDVD